MQKDSQKLPTQSTLRTLSTTIFVASLIVLVQGCATRVVPVEQTVPQTLLASELPSWKEWFKDWLTLVQSAADAISGAPQTTTPSQKQ